jgi:hypothetical protein
MCEKNVGSETPFMARPGLLHLGLLANLKVRVGKYFFLIDFWFKFDKLLIESDISIRNLL